MSKFFTLLTALGLFLCSSSTLLAQPSFLIIPQDADGNMGDSVTIDVKVVGFTDIAGYQFNLNWEETLLDFIEINNTSALNLIPPPAAIHFGATQTNNGILVCSWSDPFGLSTSLPDSTTIFSVVFELLGDPGAVEFISFAPTLEVIQNDQFGNPTDVTSMTTFTNGPATQAGYGGGGGNDPCLAATGFTLIGDTATVATGNQTCLDITACNFTDLVSIQYTMETNPAILRFDSVTNLINDLATGSLFATNNAANGYVTFNWLDSLGAGVTIPNGTVLYSMCYTAVGAGGSMDTLQVNSALTPIDVTDINSNGNNIGLSYSGGQVVISGSSASALTVGVSGTTAQNNDNICLDVSVNNFDSISGLQYTMEWDTAILNYDRIEIPSPLTLTPLNLGTHFNQSMTANGKLIFSWNSSAPGGLSLNNGDVIYQVCFDVAGMAGQSSNVDFTDDPTMREALQEDAQGMTNQVNVVTQSGQVNIVGAGDFGLYGSNEVGDTGDTVCVEIGAVGFNNIVSLQYTLAWDDNVINFVSLDNNILPPTTSAPNSSPGRLSFQWLDDFVTGVTFPDSTILYSFCFEIVGSTNDSTTVQFISESPTFIEVTQNDGMGNINAVAMDTIPGSIKVGTAIDPIIVTDTTITNVNCFGDATGAIDIEITGGTPAYTYSWSNTASSQDITGLIAGTYTVTITDDTGQTIIESYVVTEAAELMASAAGADVSCSGNADGSIDLTVSGGTGAYTYDWSDDTYDGTEDPSGLAVGTYTVTITDANGCTATSSAVIAVGTIVDIQSTTTDESCSGLADGSIDLTVSGGSGNYTYDWNDDTYDGTEDPSGLPAGTYTVTVTEDGNGCTDTATVVINAGTSLVLVATPTDISCNGAADGSIDLSVSGGSGNYSYDWSDDTYDGVEDPSGLSAGTYTVTVTEDGNGCTDTVSAVINVGASIVLVATPTDVSCNGAADGSIDLSVSGGSGNYSYDWSDDTYDGVEDPAGLSTGTYTVTVTDTTNGCTATTSAMIDEPASITANSVGVNPDCNGDMDGTINLTANGGAAPYSFLWSNMDTTEDLSGLGAGMYTVTITDAGSCTLVFFTQLTEPSLLQLTGIVTHESSPGFSDGAIDLTVTGGSPLYTYDWSDDTYDGTEDPSGLAPGSYSVTVTDNSGCIATISFVVNAADSPIPQIDLVTQISCNGANDGGITVSIMGGNTPYTFNWSNGAMTQNLTGLIPGTYTLTVTDATGNDGISQPVQIDEPPLLTATAVATDVSCNGNTDGSINLTVGGGTANYSYNWGPFIPATEDPSGLAQGTYTVTVTDANNCTVTAMATVGGPTPIGISSSTVTDADCSGSTTGGVDITASGGDGNYTYSWSDPAMTSSEDLSGVGAGTYTVTITDGNGCSFISGGFLVGEGTPIVITLVSTTNVACPEVPTGIIDIDVSGGMPNYTYEWMNNAGFTVGTSQDLVNLRGGTYTLTVTDSKGCTQVSNPITITEPLPIDIDLAVNPTSIDNDDGSISVTAANGGTPAFSYNWRGPNAYMGSGGTIASLMPGYYFLTATDANGCVETVDSILVVGVVDAISNISHVSCNGGSDGVINITIMGGISPFSYEWSDGPEFEDRPGLSAGTYTLTITDAAGTTFIETYVVNEPPPISLSNVSIVPETGTGCNGSINITITGGTPPYIYNWSNGATSQDITNVCKGKYSVDVVDAKGCILQSQEYEVLPAALQLASVNATDVKCNGSSNGEVCISTFGGCEPYSFELSVGGNSQVSLDGSACFNGLPAGNHTATVTDVFGGTLLIPFTINQPSPIVVTTTVNDNMDDTGTNCNGSILIDVSGGTPPYSFQWNNGATSEDISGLCGDLSPYSVTVIDANGCIRTISGIVLRTIRFAVQDVSCFDECDGSIDISVRGGTGPFTYAWADGETDALRVNLCAGDYEVSIINGAGQMIAVSTINVAGPSSPLQISSASQVNPLGTNNDGSINISVQGGWGGYTYQWSGPNNFSSTVQDPQLLVEGRYSVVVRDANGCQVTASYTLTGERILDNANVNDAECNGEDSGSIILSPTGGTAPYHFSWSNGDNDPAIGGLVAGTYTVTITGQNGLIGIFEYEVGEPAPLSVSFAVPGNGSATAIVTGGTPPYSYNWNTSSQDTTATVNEQPEGTYFVLVLDSNGCRIDPTPSVEIIDPTPGICDRVRYIITPNGDGENDNFFIDCDQNVTPILQVFDRWGRLVFESENYQNDWEGQTGSGEILPEGGYFYVLEFDDPITNERIQEKGHLTIIR